MSVRRLGRKDCVSCGAQKDDRCHVLAQRCDACDGPYKAAMLAANKAVNAARAKGLLQSPKDFDCVDCGRRAHDYDHRDYSKPLAVEPVCRSCNIRRGPAAFSARAAA